MPSNIIAINGASEYNVPDRKMEEFLQWLEKNAYKVAITSRIEYETEIVIQGQV